MSEASVNRAIGFKTELQNARKKLDRCFSMLYQRLKPLPETPSFETVIEMCTICTFAACKYFM